MRDIIVITMPEIFHGETDIVNALFDNGMRRLHLRKPGVSAEYLAEWTESACCSEHNFETALDFSLDCSFYRNAVLVCIFKNRVVTL